MELRELTPSPRLLHPTDTAHIPTLAAGVDDDDEHEDDSARPKAIYLWPHRFWRHRSLISFLILLVVLILQLTRYPPLKSVRSDDPANRALALIIFLVGLWTTHALPVYVVSLLTPLLAVPLGVIVSEDTALDGIEKGMLSASDSASVIFSAMFVPIVPVLLAGFAMAAALRKHTRWLAQHWSHYTVSAASRFHVVLLVLMFILLWSSVAMPNEAIAMIAHSLAVPLMEELERQGRLSACRALLMGMAMAANVGGMISPVSSPQNILAMTAIEEVSNISSADSTGRDGYPKSAVGIGWGSWLAVSIPVSHVAVVLIWLLLVAVYRSAAATAGDDLEKQQPTTTNSPEGSIDITSATTSMTIVGPPPSIIVSKRTRISLIVSVITIAVSVVGWCLVTTGHLKPLFGNIGIVSLLPLVVLFGTRILRLPDLLRLPWDIVLLAMGGSALTVVARRSGLLPALASSLAHVLAGFSPWSRYFFASLTMCLLSTLCSRFIAALVFLPVIIEVAEKLVRRDLITEGTPFILLATMACSAGMALPISGLINYSFALQTYRDKDSHRHGRGRKQKYLGWRDWALVGMLSTALTLASIVTFGWAMVERRWPSVVAASTQY